MTNSITYLENSPGGALPQGPTQIQPKKEKDKFMELLLLQMRSQDPLSPMDTAQFFNQLAQLTMLEQLWEMNDRLEESTTSQQLAQGSQLIGRHIQANTPDDGVISGLVEQVRMISGEVLLQVGDKDVRLDEIVSVQ